MINMIDRNECVITHERDLEHLYTFKNFPVLMGCVDHSESEDLMADMIWNISKSSGVIQLGKLIPLNVLYSASHDAGAVGALWMKHHKAFAEFILGFNPSFGGVLEIGGGHGILAKECNSIKNIPWTIIEPNPPVSETGSDSIRYVKGFFDENFKFDGAFDAIVHANVFEHMYDVDSFVKQISNLMNCNQKLIFSTPNLKLMLERKNNSCLSFEHTIYLLEDYVDYLLSQHGFRILKKQYFKEYPSIFYSAIKDVGQNIIELDKELYAKNKSLFMEYVYYYRELIEQLNDKIFMCDSPIYLFGAHVFSQYLIAFGLNTAKVTCILDNAKSKQGKRLYGTELKVESPKVLKSMVNPVVILKAGAFDEEIRNDILENINATTVFW